LERIFVSIWDIVNQEQFDKLSKNRDIEDDLVVIVTEIVYEQILNKSISICEYSTPSHCDYINMRLFIKRRLPTWVRSAFHVKDMTPNDTYIITSDTLDKSSDADVRITVMDKDTGVEQSSTRWSNGVHQFLQLKHTRRLAPESLKAVFISNLSFFKRYKQNIMGLTGSLGSAVEQNLLNQVYNLRFFKLPRFYQELFRQLPSGVFTEQTNWLEGIKKAIDREIKLKVKITNRDKRRAVLVICENVKTVLVLKEYLSNSYPNVREYKSAYEKFNIDEMSPGDIIIATNLAGRGTDLDTSHILEENGGLHVITAYLPSNVRIEMQAFGRTARNGHKGNGQK
jgi:preprotein translocase subunit SecA